MIYAFNGGLHSGKDTVAKIWQLLAGTDTSFVTLEPYIDQCDSGKADITNYKGSNGGWEIKKFATKLKQTIALWLNIPVEDLEKEEVKNSLLPDEWQVYYLADKDRVILPGKPWYATEEEAIKFCENTNSSYKQSTYVKSQRTVRWLLVYWGTDLFRDKTHPNIHINGLFSEYKPQCKSYCKRQKQVDDPACTGEGDCDCLPNWLITDLRFKNCAKRIQESNGLMIKVVRPFCLRFPQYSSLVHDNRGIYFIPKDLELIDTKLWEILNSPSETELQDYKGFKYLIKNDGSISDLVKTVRQIMISEQIIEK